MALAFWCPKNAGLKSAVQATDFSPRSGTFPHFYDFIIVFA